MPDAVRFAHLSQGKLHLHGEHAVRTLESAFGRSLRERAAQIRNRNSWKMRGRGAQFAAGVLWAGQPGDAAEFRLAITSVTPGRQPGEIFYSLETDEVSGVFEIDAEGGERRLFHTSDFRVRHLAASPERGRLAATLATDPMTAHIAVMQIDGAGFHELTEGDSVDLAPQWSPEQEGSIVFQSAGVGRDPSGRPTALGPFAVQQVDAGSGDLRTLAESDGHDLLGPRKSADGSLYYIRRPWQNRKVAVSPLDAVKDAVLFPFRLGYAIFQYFNFFSMMYTGKPLATSKGAAQRQPDLKQMMVWGNLIDAGRAAREAGNDAEAPSLVPSTWQLIRQEPGGTTHSLANGVLSFDLAPDGSILYSNGSAIFHLEPGAKPARVFVGKWIEQVAAV